MKTRLLVLGFLIGPTAGQCTFPPAERHWAFPEDSAQVAALARLDHGTVFPATPDWSDVTAKGDVGHFWPDPGARIRAAGKPSRINSSRMTGWGAVHATGLYAAYRKSQAAWGASNGRFHFKADFKGDGMALNDEFSHLFAAYQVVNLLRRGYAWTGVSPERARRIAAVESWLLTFLVEYPIDSYNPQQGFGVSDLLFNTMGVGAAYYRAGSNSHPAWDVKISVKRSFFAGGSRLIAYTNKQYDDYIYWMTVRPISRRSFPVLLGLGYSTKHGEWPRITKEIHVGAGMSLEEVGELIGGRAADYLRPLNFFFLNLNTKITWR